MTDNNEELLEEIQEWYMSRISTALQILHSNQPIKLQDPDDPENKIEIIGRELMGFKRGLSFAMLLFDDMPQLETDEYEKLSYPFNDECPRCQSKDLTKEEVEGSHSWAYNYTCNVCDLKFEVILTDRAGGNHNDTIILDYHENTD